MTPPNPSRYNPLIQEKLLIRNVMQVSSLSESFQSIIQTCTPTNSQNPRPSPHSLNPTRQFQQSLVVTNPSSGPEVPNQETPLVVYKCTVILSIIDRLADHLLLVQPVIPHFLYVFHQLFPLSIYHSKGQGGHSSNYIRVPNTTLVYSRISSCLPKSQTVFPRPHE